MASSSSSSPSSFEYVGFWKRVVASLIDTFILMALVVPLMLAVYGLQYFDPQRQLSGQAGGALDWLVNIALIAITILFWRYRGATPGKMAISARIVDAKTGAAPSTGALVVRFLGYIASMLPFFLGFLWIAVDRKKQGFHDKIAGTVVVYDDD